MTTPIWDNGMTRGYLPINDPLPTLAHHTDLPNDSGEVIENILAQLPKLMTSTIRTEIESMSIYDMADVVATGDMMLIERIFQAYGFLATAYVFPPNQPTTNILPASIAKPLVTLSEAVKRPPILSYAPYTLVNWKRIDPNQPITVDNLELLYGYITERDAAWFTLIHVDIEARGHGALYAVHQANLASQTDDNTSVIASLKEVVTSLDAMMATFKRMPEHCNPDIYFNRVRPYMFGFDDMVFEGCYDNQPQNLRGETGAQSSLVPTIVAGLGLAHQESDMTQHLDIMRDYMPREHVRAMEHASTSGIREYVLANTQQGELVDAYNGALDRLLAFRKLHLSFAKMYIADKVDDPRGTGGTMFMRWLRQLIDETDAHWVR